MSPPAASKYDPLAARLAAHDGGEWRASFAEIELVLGFPLPKTARTTKAWWRNDNAQPHQRAWTAGGWEAGELDQGAGAVIFRRAGASAPAPAPAAVAAADEPAILTRLESGPGWGVLLIAGGVALVAGVGYFALRGFSRRS